MWKNYQIKIFACIFILKHEYGKQEENSFRIDPFRSAGILAHTGNITEDNGRSIKSEFYILYTFRFQYH